MKINTKPTVDGGAPCVTLSMGSESALLTARQAEEIAESLNRAATAARYESAIAEMLEERYARGSKIDAECVDRVRQLIEKRRKANN